MFPGGQTYQEGHSPLTQFLISSYLDSAHNTSWCVSAWVSIPVGGGGCFYYLLGPWHDQLGLFRGQTPRENSVRKESLILCVKTKSRERRWRWRAHVTKLMCIPDFLKDRIFFPPAVYFVKKIKISSLCISWLSVHLGGPENTQTKYSVSILQHYGNKKTEGSADCQLHIHKVLVVSTRMTKLKKCFEYSNHKQ